MLGFSLQCYSHRLWETLPLKVKTGAGEMVESLSTWSSGRDSDSVPRIQWFLILGHLRTYFGLYGLMHLGGTHKLTHATHTYTQTNFKNVLCLLC